MFEVLFFSAAVAGILLARSFWHRYRTPKARLFRKVRQELNRVALAMEALGAVTAESMKAFAEQMKVTMEILGQKGGLR